MAAEIYRLETLYEMRERQKKSAEDAYAISLKRLMKEKNLLREMEAKLQRMKEYRAQKKLEFVSDMREGKLNIAEINICDRHLEKLSLQEERFLLQINKQKEAVEKAKESKTQALDKMIRATKHFKALQKHKNRWLRSRQLAAQKKEEEAADEISLAQHFLDRNHQREI